MKEASANAFIHNKIKQPYFFTNCILRFLGALRCLMLVWLPFGCLFFNRCLILLGFVWFHHVNSSCTHHVQLNKLPHSLLLVHHLALKNYVDYPINKLKINTYLTNMNKNIPYYFKYLTHRANLKQEICVFMKIPCNQIECWRLFLDFTCCLICNNSFVISWNCVNSNFISPSE